jgi:hypothetical protein
MRFRFLYLGKSGSQTEVASLDDLRLLIEKGTVEEVTPLFDVLTQSWAPARSHAVYRLLCDEARGESGAAATAPPVTLPDLGLTVTAAAPSLSSTDQAVRDLMREREREGDPDRKPRDSWSNSTSWGARQTASAGVAPPEVARVAPSDAASRSAPAPRTAPVPGPLAQRGEARKAPAPAAVRAQPQPDDDAPVAVPAHPRPIGPSLLAMTVPFDRLRDWVLNRIARLAEHRFAPAFLVATGIAGLLVVLVTAVRGAGPQDAGAPTTIAGPDVRGLVGRFALAEDSGFRHMVAGIDSLRRAYDVVDVPSAWLEGRYLADATRYPEVEEYWVRYRAFLNAVEATDTALFRAGFAAQLRDEGVQGPVLSLRLSQAMGSFEETQPTRSSMYLHMDELARASLALHELLVEREPDITYEPALARRLSRDPVVEALPLDTLLRDRMWVLLDRIFASLERLSGDLGANRDNLTEALLQGVEASQH